MKKNSFRVLLAPLDWGLGHTTRCIPIIKALLNAGCTVYVACNQVSEILLTKEFPQVSFLPLDGYHIHYASSKRKFAIKILQQTPKIIAAIRRENRWLRLVAQQYQFDLIISDNRFGFYHPQITSVFITHQLQIQTPFAPLSKLIRLVNYRLINRFSACWVPDYAAQINIAGALSHPQVLPKTPVTYIGPLSRLAAQSEKDYRYKWLVVLSGPEPQRTLLESALVNAVSLLKDAILFVRGLPAEANDATLAMPAHCTVVNHLSSAEMSVAFAQSEYVISRSGYTTVMEILASQKKSILIPTPGQTEQEYLAKHLMKQHWCFAGRQGGDILPQLQQASQFGYRLPQLPRVSLEEIINNYLNDLVMNEVVTPKR